jgi:hypothetical protein
MDITTIYVDIDDFCKYVAAQLLPACSSTQERRVRQPELLASEVMTILVWFHHAGYRTFKTYYKEYVHDRFRAEFPALPSYNRFLELAKRVVMPLGLFLTTRYGRCTGISFIDATTLDVCANQRIHQHKVFNDLAARGKTSTGWFYGFKLHVTVNDCGGLLGVCFTAGNVDERDRAVIDALTKRLKGTLVGDKGYISQPLSEELRAKGLEMLTKIKKGMRNKVMLMFDKLLLRKRALIECVIDALKNQCQIEHSRHRSVWGGIVTILAGLVMYTYLPKKPCLRFTEDEQHLLLMLADAG